MSATIDNTDTLSLGFVTSDWPNLWDALDFDYPTTRISGRDGAVHLSRIGQGQGRDRLIDWVAYGRAADRATLITAVRDLKRRVMRRQIEIGLTTEPDIAWDAVLVRAPMPSIAPAETQSAININWTFQILDAVAHELVDTVIDFTAGATACPTGNMPSFPLIELVGPVTDPEVILVSGGGSEIVRISFNYDVPAGVVLGIDCDNLQLLVDGTPDNSIEITGDFPWLDPLHYNGSTPPTLECSPVPALATATYRKKVG